jgi:hypothetical protein
MPGLVGAVMRRSGFYAALRQGISHHGDGAVGAAISRSTVTVKLFNLLLPELAPLILARGILLDEAALAGLRRLFPETLCREEPDGVPECFPVHLTVILEE